MAKGKNAAALFEVIHSGRENAPRPILNTPKWWWKRRSRNALTSTSMFAAPNAPGVSPGTDSIATEDNPTAEFDPTQAHTMIHAPMREATMRESTTPEPHAADETSNERGDGAVMPMQSTATAQAVDVALDSERRLITFKFSYNSAIISAFTIVVVVMLAYLVGKKMSAGPTAVMATETTAQLRGKPAHPDVLNVTPRNSALQPAQQTLREPEVAITSRTNEAIDADRNVTANTAGGREGPGGVAGSNSVSTSVGRELGLNYVVVQSYPDEKGANEARDALVKSGINATIEQKLRGLNQSWFIVVGMRGFARASGAEYDAYLQKIQDVSGSFSRGKRSFKAFQPIPYKWDKPGSQKPVG